MTFQNNSAFANTVSKFKIDIQKTKSLKSITALNVTEKKSKRRVLSANIVKNTKLASVSTATTPIKSKEN